MIFDGRWKWELKKQSWAISLWQKAPSYGEYGKHMGFFQGPRNLYQDNHIGSGVSNTISVIIEASFFLHLLDGRSITQNGRWITKKVDYREIYQKVPKRIDRWKLVRLLKKNHCCTQMRWNYGTNDFVLPDNQHSR